MLDISWLMAAVTVLLVAMVFGTSLQVERRWLRQTAQPGWWAPVAERERLQQILARNPSYDERTGLTSDPELARWWHENRP